MKNYLKRYCIVHNDLNNTIRVVKQNVILANPIFNNVIMSNLETKKIAEAFAICISLIKKYKYIR